MNCVMRSAGDHRVLVDPNLAAERRCHPDDRLDAVVVDEKGDEQQECLFVAAQLVEGCHETPGASAYEAAALGFAGLDSPRRLWHLAKEGYRKHEPPDADAGERQPDGGARVRDPEPCRALNHQQIDGQQHAAAEVTDGITRRRHPIELGFADEMGEERLVEHDAGSDGDVPEHEEHQPELPIAGAHPEHRHRREDADHDEDAEHLLLHRRIVRDGAKKRRDQSDDDDGDRRCPGEAARGQRVAKLGGDDVVEIDRENGGDDRCLKGGVRPVVHRPCAQLRPSKTEAFQ